jgi:hypothetical protein
VEEAELPPGRADGAEGAHSTVLSGQEEAMVVAFRKHTLLPLDDCLYALQPTIPHLSRSARHRCFQRHGISRLPEIAGDKPDERSRSASRLRLATSNVLVLFLTSSST